MMTDPKNVSHAGPLSETQKSFRFWFHLALIVVLLLMAGRAQAEQVTVTDEAGRPWTIEVRPITTTDPSHDEAGPALLVPSAGSSRRPPTPNSTSTCSSFPTRLLARR